MAHVAALYDWIVRWSWRHSRLSVALTIAGVMVAVPLVVVGLLYSWYFGIGNTSGDGGFKTADVPWALGLVCSLVILTATVLIVLALGRRSSRSASRSSQGIDAGVADAASRSSS